MDLTNVTKQALYDMHDGGAPYYITGDVTAVGHPPAVSDSNMWFYLLGRRTDLGTQLGGAGEDRGLTTQDMLRKAKADNIMLMAGLYQRIDEIRIALRSNISEDALVSSVHPIKLMRGKVDIAVYVTLITKPYWPSAEMPNVEQVKRWRSYINNETQVSKLIFVAADQIPRTPPPLLKPNIGAMKKQISKWLEDNDKKEVTEDVCMEMSQARVVCPNRSARSAKLLPLITFGAPMVFLSLLLGFM